MTLEYYSKGSFLYAFDTETKYLFEADVNTGETVSVWEPGNRINWSEGTRRILEGTFRRHMARVKNLNPFIPKHIL